MSHECFSIDEFETIADLPEHDPRLAHLDDCPRCRSRLAAYRDFMVPARDLGGSRLAEAEAALGLALDRELGLAGPRPRPEPRAVRPAQRSLRELLAEWFGASALRPALAAAAMLAVVAAGYGVLRPVAPRMRGDASAVAFKAAMQQGAQSVSLDWSPVTGADRYEVRFFTSDLGDLARVDAGGATRFELRRDALPTGLAPRAPVLWQIVALAGERELATSALQSMQVP